MDETLMKIRILAHAEMTLAQVRGRVLGRRLLLIALAVGAGLLTIAMFNMGAFEMLAEGRGEAVAAFLVAAANGLLAAILLGVASRLKPGPEEDLVQEIRDLALSELASDADAVKEHFQEISADLGKIRHGVTSLTGSAAAGLGSLGPVINLAVDLLKQRKG